jgi:hypothetical protein
MPLFLSIVSFLLPIYSLVVGGIASFFPLKYTILGVLLSKYSIHVFVTYPATHRPGYATFKPTLGLLSLTDTFLKFNKDA